MLSPGDRVLVAVSGGPDSVALLYLLHKLSYPVVAAHLNHGTRGAESDADAALARALADRLGIPFCEERRDVPAEVAREGRNFHEYARAVRYAFLCRAAREQGCAAVATGHHADDATETLLMRLVRGTGPRGLAGIPPVSDWDGVRVVRPLIECRRSEILAYLGERGIEWREDSSNAQPKYLRNRVRRELLPLLERDFNPQVREGINRLARALRSEDDYLSAQAEAFLRGCMRGEMLDRAAFSQGHLALQRRAVLELARRQEAECPFERVDAAVDFILEAPAGKAFHAGDFRLWSARESVDTDPGEPPSDEPTPLTVPGEAVVEGRRFAARLLESAPENLRAYCGPGRQVFDADAAGDALWLRHWRAGDRFTPLGMEGSRKLQDYFTDLHLPRRARARQLLLLSGERILWVVGRAVDAAGAVTKGSRHILEVEVSCEAE
jgi:tRNA(Ile)-lysidine synthase